MIKDALSSLALAFDAVYEWFVLLFNRVGGVGYILGVLFAMFAIRFIVYPFLKGGVGASDPARSFYNRRDLSEKR